MLLRVRVVWSPQRRSRAVAPLRVIMYGRFTRNTTLMTAHSTIGQRATNRIAPRHDKRRPDGMCQSRVQIQIVVLTTPIGSQWNRYGRRSTLEGVIWVMRAKGG